MDKVKFNIEEAIKISEVKISDREEDNWRRMGFIGALLGVDSSEHFREEQGLEYKKGFKLGEEYLAVQNKIDEL